MPRRVVRLGCLTWPQLRGRMLRPRELNQQLERAMQLSYWGNSMYSRATFFRDFVLLDCLFSLSCFFRNKTWAVFNPSHSVYVFGGGAKWNGQAFDQLFDDIWRWDLQTNTWTEIETHGIHPPPTCFHAAATLQANIYIFGGVSKTPSGTDPTNEIFIFKPGLSSIP